MLFMNEKESPSRFDLYRNPKFESKIYALSHKLAKVNGRLANIRMKPPTD